MKKTRQGLTSRKRRPSTPSKSIKGIIKKHPDGFGFLIPDDEDHPDVYISASSIGTALTDDYVEADVQSRSDENKFFGTVTAILRRGKEFAIGSYELINEEGVIPKHNLSCKDYLYVQNPQNIEVQTKDWLKIKITQYPSNDQDLEGEIVENLGAINSSAQDDIKRTLAEHDISFHFPEEVMEEVNQFPEEVMEEDFKDRKDLRDKTFVTIDGQTAKDFDDAIYVEKNAEGYKLFIAIADVSHYVKENTALDKEAFQRGNSTYLPNICIPMLPEKLSNDLCSLNPLVPRLVMVSEIDYDFNGDILKTDFYPSVIISKKRLTYGEAQDIIDGFSKEAETLPFLEHANDLAKILLKNHYKEGALNLEITETSLVIDELGEVTDFVKEQRLFAHQMIEQFMLAANKAVSAYLESKSKSFMYRVHEDPKADKLKNLQIFAKILGFSSLLDSRKNIIEFLSDFKDHEKEPLIHKLVLRSLSQARYSAKNNGHYGLNFKSYSHFTSPIRRYCDLMIHRAVKECLFDSGKSLSIEEIESQATLISAAEQKSVKVERQINDIKKARFLTQHIGKPFKGIISSITSFGLFVSIKEFDIEGLIRLRDMPGHWEVDDINLRLIASRSHYIMNFGDEVEIQVSLTNPLTGNIDFELLTHQGNKLPEERSFRDRGFSRGRDNSRPQFRSSSSSRFGRRGGSDDGERRSFRGRGGSDNDERKFFGKGRDSSDGERRGGRKSLFSSDEKPERRDRDDESFDAPQSSTKPKRKKFSGGTRTLKNKYKSDFRDGRDSDSGERRSFRGRSSGDGERRSFGGRSSGDGERRPFRGRSSGDGERRSFGGRSSGDGERRSFRGRSSGDGERRSFGGRSSGDGERRSFGGRSSGDGERRSFRGRSSGDGERRSFGGRSSGDGERRSFRGRSSGDGERRSFRGRSSRDGERRSFGGRSSGDGERRSFRGRSSGDGERRSFRGRSSGDGERRSFRGRSSGDGERRSFGGRSSGDGERRSFGGRSSGDGERRSFGGRSSGDGERRSFRGRSSGDGERRSFGGRSSGDGERRSFRGRGGSDNDRPFKRKTKRSDEKARKKRQFEARA